MDQAIYVPSVAKHYLKAYRKRFGEDVIVSKRDETLIQKKLSVGFAPILLNAIITMAIAKLQYNQQQSTLSYIFSEGVQANIQRELARAAIRTVDDWQPVIDRTHLWFDGGTDGGSDNGEGFPERSAREVAGNR